MILHYLLALPEFDAVTSPRLPRSPAAVKRRQSLMLLNVPDKEDDRMNPFLFNLVDLILGSTESHDAQTVLAALKLATVILGKHHTYAVGSLIKVMHVHQKEPHRTIGAFNKELEIYLELAISLAGDAGVDEAYESHLKDKLSLLESHPCSLKALAMPTLSAQALGYFDTETGMRDVGLHYLIPEDPLFKSLLDQLVLFLTNDVETNLALTEAIITLGSCSQLRLEGWLAVDPSEYHHQHEHEEESTETIDEKFKDLHKAARQPAWEKMATPSLLVCLQNLQSQVDALRADIQDWDDHVASRKHVFQTYEELSEVSKNTASQAKPVRPDAQGGSWNPQIPRHVIESATPSRTSSPRGRKEALDKRHTPSSSPAPSKLSGQTFVGSPSRGMSPLSAPRVANTNRQTTFMTDVLGNLADVNNNPNLKRRIRFRRTANSQDIEVMLSKYQPPPKEPSEAAGAGAEEAESEEFREASVGHIITNVVILQEFVLELVALMQTRASLFNEIRFA